jgi:hypothetical protein
MKDNSRVVSLVLLGWLCFAVGLSGWFHNASAQGVAVTVWALTALALLACWKITPIRVWALNVDLRWLVLFHLTRLFAGVCFLVLCQRDQLPCGFARPAGWGDILVAVLALVVVGAMRTEFAKKLLLIWNTLGLIDIIFCCLERAALWLERLAVNAHAAGTATQSSPDISGADYYRLTRFDFRPTA